MGTMARTSVGSMNNTGNIVLPSIMSVQVSRNEEARLAKAPGCMPRCGSESRIDVVVMAAARAVHSQRPCKGSELQAQATICDVTRVICQPF